MSLQKSRCMKYEQKQSNDYQPLWSQVKSKQLQWLIFRTSCCVQLCFLDKHRHCYIWSWLQWYIWNPLEHSCSKKKSHKNLYTLPSFWKFLFLQWLCSQNFSNRLSCCYIEACTENDLHFPGLTRNFIYKHFPFFSARVPHSPIWWGIRYSPPHHFITSL